MVWRRTFNSGAVSEPCREMSSLHETLVLLDQKRKILEGRIKELETNRKGKYIKNLCGSLNSFKHGYQIRPNLIIVEKIFTVSY
jgi:hypothetical protein